VALKDFDDTNPRTRDKNWKEDISVAELPKMDEWYPFRIVGGVFSYAQHWIEFVNKGGEKKRYPVDCANWDPDNESANKKGGCPACEVGLRPSVRYMMNVIDRTAQQRGDADPIRALDIPPTVMRQLLDLKKLNMVKGEAKSIAHPKLGCDIHLQKQRSKKRGGVEWQVQKGDRSPLTEEETSLEFISFDEHYQEPDVHKIREDLKRHGYFDANKSDNDGDDDTEALPKKGSKKPSRSSDDDEDFEETPKSSAGKPAKAKKPPVDDDEEDDAPSPPKKKRPPVDDDDDEEDAPPPKPKKKPPVDDDDDEEDAPPPKPKKKPPVDDDEDDAPPPPKAKKKPPVDEDDDDFDDEFGDL
jgi:hypothetical protein